MCAGPKAPRYAAASWQLLRGAKKQSSSQDEEVADKHLSRISSLPDWIIPRT